MNLLQRIKSRATMKVKRLAFTDRVSYKKVYLCEDCYGNEFLAELGFFGFRINLEVEAKL